MVAPVTAGPGVTSMRTALASIARTAAAVASNAAARSVAIAGAASFTASSPHSLPPTNRCMRGFARGSAVGNVDTFSASPRAAGMWHAAHDCIVPARAKSDAAHSVYVLSSGNGKPVSIPAAFSRLRSGLSTSWHWPHSSELTVHRSPAAACAGLSASS